jgi:hypothetical protein
MTALQWSWERRARRLQHEREGLIERVRDAEERAAEFKQSQARAEAVERQIAQMHATRAWRVAASYWNVRDRLTSRLGARGRW